MKTLGIALAVVCALMVGGCAASAPVSVPEIVGMPADEARDVLEEAGFDVDLEADGWVIIESNWTVDVQSPEAGAQKAHGSTVTMTVSKHEDEEVADESEESDETEAEATPAPATESADETSSGLSFGWAMTTCDKYGQDASPFGWNADFIMDGTHVVRGDAMFLKAGVSVTNAYGTEGRYTVECLVSGSDEAPVVDAFNVY